MSVILTPPGDYGRIPAGLRVDRSMDGKWLSYADAAVLGKTPESARQRARREHWRKQLGNDGKALILVPADADCIPPGDTADTTLAFRPAKRPEGDTASAALQARLTEMEAGAAELRADVERERGERLQERGGADRLTDEIAALARRFAQTVQEASTPETDLRDQLTQAKEVAASNKARLASITSDMEALWLRPWWRRLAGWSRRCDAEGNRYSIMMVETELRPNPIHVTALQSRDRVLSTPSVPSIAAWPEKPIMENKHAETGV